MSDRATVVGVRAPGEPWIFEEALPDPVEGQVRVDVLYSGISAGTELTYVKGTNPFLHASWDAELGLFEPGVAATSLPLERLGYMEVGRVAESRDVAFAPGDLVALTCGHRSAQVVDPRRERLVALPAELDPLLGIYVAHMGPICANGLLHAAADLAPASAPGLGDGVAGRFVLVTGAGVIGLLVGLFARHLGAAEVAVADVTPERLAVAERFGLLAIDERRQDPWDLLKRRWRHGAGDRGADVAFQCRGRPAALATALKSLRPQATVVDLAFYTEGADAVRLGEEFHHNGLGVRCAQIGRVPRGLAHAWDRERLSRETIALLRAHGDVVRRHLITDVVPAAEAPELLCALADRRRQVIQAVLDYRPAG
jgi:threonine dehydrogenase-like Zn-dependent dehydrogenase